MQHGQKVEQPPRALLAAAGFAVKEIAEGHLCCGSAGTYNVLQPELATRLRERKLAHIARTRRRRRRDGQRRLHHAARSRRRRSRRAHRGAARLGDGRAAAAGARELRARHAGNAQARTEVSDMIDPKQLLDQVLGSAAAGNARNAGRESWTGSTRRKARKRSQAAPSRAGCSGCCWAAGRRHGGGLLGYGGAAALGALALQAYQNYQRQQGGGGAAGSATSASAALPHAQPGGRRQPVRARARACDGRRREGRRPHRRDRAAAAIRRGRAARPRCRRQGLHLRSADARRRSLRPRARSRRRRSRARKSISRRGSRSIPTSLPSVRIWTRSRRA